MLKTSHRNTKAKTPQERAKSKKPRKVTKKHVAISFGGLMLLLGAAAPYVTPFLAYLTSPQRVESAPNPPPDDANTNSSRNDGAYWGKMPATIIRPEGAPLRSGPGEDKEILVNMSKDEQVEVQRASCSGLYAVIDNKPGRWCRATYTREDKLYDGWIFDQHFLRKGK